MTALRRTLADDEIDLLVMMLDEGPVHMYADRGASADTPARFLSTPNLQRLIGRRPMDVGALFDELDGRVGPGHAERLADARAAAVRREPATVEVQLRDDDGGLRWWRFSTVARDGGSVMLGYIWDITEAIEAAGSEATARAEAEASRDEALAAVRARTDLLSRMSHELRTPLNSIMGFGQLLELQDLASPEREWVASLVDAGRHLLTLVDQVLDVVGIETGRLEVSLEAIEVMEIIDEAIGLLATTAEEWEVAVVLRRGPMGEVWAIGDQHRVLQILLNLIDNAIRYNRAGGTVAITAEAVAGRVVVEVADTGPGLRDDQIEQAFRPFDRLGSERTGIEGRGMGLTLARSLAERMGGTLAMTSSPGSGTSLRLDLRAGGPAELRRSGDDRGDAASPEGRITILYIEDNVANLRLMESVLELRPSVGLVTAMRGRLGIDIARDQRPDLVLVDLHLPDMDGREVVRQIRAEPRTADLPLVVVSADATEDRIEEVRRLGADHYLTKPIDIHELISLVDRYLDQEGTGDRA